MYEFIVSILNFFFILYPQKIKVPFCECPKNVLIGESFVGNSNVLENFHKLCLSTTCDVIHTVMAIQTKVSSATYFNVLPKACLFDDADISTTFVFTTTTSTFTKKCLECPLLV